MLSMLCLLSVWRHGLAVRECQRFVAMTNWDYNGALLSECAAGPGLPPLTALPAVPAGCAPVNACQLCRADTRQSMRLFR